jgi:hypothetical protein
VTDAEKGKVSTGIAVYTALLWVYDLLGSMNELADPALDEEGLSLSLSKERARARTKGGSIMISRTTASECYVYITLPGETEFVTAGKFELTTNRQGNPAGKFVYGRSYLARDNAVSIDPLELKLSTKTYETNILNAALASGYDFVSTIAYLDDENRALKYARSRKIADLSIDELAYLAAKAGLSENVVIDVALETVERFRYIWAKEKSNLPITSAMAAKIEKNAMAVKLYNESK